MLLSFACALDFNGLQLYQGAFPRYCGWVGRPKLLRALTRPEGAVSSWFLIIDLVEERLEIFFEVTWRCLMLLYRFGRGFYRLVQGHNHVVPLPRKSLR